MSYLFIYLFILRLRLATGPSLVAFPYLRHNRSSSVVQDLTLDWSLQRVHVRLQLCRAATIVGKVDIRTMSDVLTSALLKEIQLQI